MATRKTKTAAAPAYEYTSLNFLPVVFKTASETANATQLCVDMLVNSHIKWSDTKRVAEIAREFRIGRMAAILGKSRDETIVIDGKQKYNPDSNVQGDHRRTKVEHDAYRAGISGWSHVARLAGFKTAKGNTRADRSTKGGSKPLAGAPVADKKGNVTFAAADAVRVKHAIATVGPLTAPVANAGDVVIFAAHLADLVSAFDKRAGKALASPWKAIFADFVSTVRKAAATLPAGSPAAPSAKPAKPAKASAAAIAAAGRKPNGIAVSAAK